MAINLFSCAQIDLEFAHLYPDLDLQILESDSGVELGRCLDLGSNVLVEITPTERGFKAAVVSEETDRTFRYEYATHSTFALRKVFSAYLRMKNVPCKKVVRDHVTYMRSRKAFEATSAFPTHKQRISISLIERNLDVEFEGTTIQDADAFIRDYIEESKAVG